MDGHFVPNITLGPPVVQALRKHTKLPLDCHLMIEDPDRYIPAFADAGADWISVHQEACRHLDRSLNLIKSHGCRAGVVINPATPVELLSEVLDVVDYILVMSVNPGFGGQRFLHNALNKIGKLHSARGARGLNYQIEIDGGVSLETIGEVVRAGADVLVIGSAIYGNEGSADAAENLRKLLTAAREATMTHV